MNAAIRRGLRLSRPLPLTGALREEIAHWLFLQTWDNPLPWRDERHVRLPVASDASGSGWGGSIVSSVPQSVSDYWTHEEQSWDISVREAIALDKVLLAFQDRLVNARVDALVDNLAVVHSWTNQGGSSVPLSRAIKRLFLTTAKLNIVLHLSYVPTGVNPADPSSHRLSSMDGRLTPELWSIVERYFGGPAGHTCDLMALDSNAMIDRHGNALPHSVLTYPYGFSPLSLVGSVLRFLQRHCRSCTLVTLDVYQRKYWWPLLQRYSSNSLKLDVQGSHRALFIPTRTGWRAHPGLPGDLWVFALEFSNEYA